MPELKMPSLGADMEAGTLVEWSIVPGDRVKRGQVVALVETAKGIIEIESWQEGVVQALVAKPGDTVPVNAVIATFEGAAASTPVVTSRPTPVPAGTVPTLGTAEVPPASTGSRGGSRVAASPAARRLARELGVDLALVHGTGPHDAITHGDVGKAAMSNAASSATPGSMRAALPVAVTAAAPASPPSRVGTMRDAIAAAMSRSKREIPHYYLETDIDLADALAWLAAQNATRPVAERMLPAALLLAATARAAREVPEMNGLFVDGAFRASERVHLGVVLSLRGGGLVAPALHDADRPCVPALMRALSDLILRTRRGGLRSSELSDPTITVTNLGDTGVERVLGVIYPPQVALVGFGRITERPWARNGMLGVHPVVTATLAADHRVSDGHRGAAFLAGIAQRLADPAAWALEGEA